MRRLLFCIVVMTHMSVVCYSQETSMSNYRVTYFLSSTCKICQFYSIELREIYKDYNQFGFEFVGLFPGKLETDSTLQSFKELYQLPFPVSLDTTKHVDWKATITPEVFVTDEQGAIIYYGRIDDAYFSVGKRRARVKHRELRDVLDSLYHTGNTSIRHEPAVGCIIEK